MSLDPAARQFALDGLKQSLDLENTDAIRHARAFAYYSGLLATTPEGFGETPDQIDFLAFLESEAEYHLEKYMDLIDQLLV